MILLSLHWSSVLAAFLASFVEFVEALTIVLAVGAVRGWRPAMAGAIAAAIVLTAAIVLFGARLTELNVPLFKLIVGVLLLLFGLRWMRKAILRSAGVLKLHDEATIYATEMAALKGGQAAVSGFDFAAAATSFNGVFIEGVEVIFIVLAVGATSSKILPAAVGAGAAALLVILLGFIARHPLTNIPENTLKLIVGVLISSFGTFWTGTGIGISWPMGDWTLITLSLFYAIVAIAGVMLALRAHYATHT